MHYIPSHLYDLYAPYRRAPLPVADKAWKRCITLPLYPDLTTAQQEQVVTAIRLFAQVRMPAAV